MPRETRRSAKSPASIARENALRQKLHSHKPTADELLASGDYEETTMEDYHQLMRLFAKLKQARHEAGLSLADVSKRSGLDRAAISRLENGSQTNPTIATLGRYARALGMELVFRCAKLAPKG